MTDPVPTLKPCPFCGEKPDLNGSRYGASIMCRNPACGVPPKLVIYDYPEEARTIAIFRWNTRTDPAEALSTHLDNILSRIRIEQRMDGSPGMISFNHCRNDDFKRDVAAARQALAEFRAQQ